ncbi:MAG: response regulator transcription factor [Rhodospirillaceae bacterium]|nr:response regulator transcription factor [Rhodospirillaceae bacterium]
MAGRRVLIIEDDAVLCRSLSEQILAQDDFALVETAALLAEGVAIAQAKRFDAVIVSAGISGGGGFALGRELRTSGVMWPLLILGAEEPNGHGVMNGVFDVLAKPFRMGVLLARLRALVRVFENSDEAVLTIGPYTFQPASKHLVEDDERIIRLTEKEASILKYLYRAGDTMVSREVLLHEVWGYNPAVTTHTLETHVYRLRQKIEKDPSDAKILVTDSGGYRLVP